ncbi:hypothetical protein GCM10027053_17330 [Intrasporangium mesophilum]
MTPPKKRTPRPGQAGTDTRRSGRHPEAIKTVVRLTDAAMDDLENIARRGDPQVVRWALKKCIHLEKNPEAGEPLKGALIGYRKLTIGDRDWRVVWRVFHDDVDEIIIDIAEVWAVGARADAEVYAEMQARAASMGSSSNTVALAEAIERLGKVGAGFSAAAEPRQAATLPSWLREVLIKVVGMAPADVDNIDTETATQLWDRYTRGETTR